MAYTVRHGIAETFKRADVDVSGLREATERALHDGDRRVRAAAAAQAVDVLRHYVREAAAG